MRGRSINICGIINFHGGIGDIFRWVEISGIRRWCLLSTRMEEEECRSHKIFARQGEKHTTDEYSFYTYVLMQKLRSFIEQMFNKQSLRVLLIIAALCCYCLPRPPKPIDNDAQAGNLSFLLVNMHCIIVSFFVWVPQMFFFFSCCFSHCFCAWVSVW